MNTYEFRPWREGDDLELLQVWGDPRSEQEAQQRASFGEASDGTFSAEPLWSLIRVCLSPLAW